MSRPSTSRPRATRARAAGLVLVAAVALGACSGQRSVPDSYGDTTERNFTDGCEEALTSDESFSGDAENVCQCSYEEISDEQNGVPFEDFKELNGELEKEPGPLSGAIRERIEICKERAGLS